MNVVETTTSCLHLCEVSAVSVERHADLHRFAVKALTIGVESCRIPIEAWLGRTRVLRWASATWNCATGQSPGWRTSVTSTWFQKGAIAQQGCVWSAVKLSCDWWANGSPTGLRCVPLEASVWQERQRLVRHVPECLSCNCLILCKCKQQLQMGLFAWMRCWTPSEQRWGRGIQPKRGIALGPFPHHGISDRRMNEYECINECMNACKFFE